MSAHASNESDSSRKCHNYSDTLLVTGHTDMRKGFDLFLQVWRPEPDPEFAVQQRAALASQDAVAPAAPWQGWLPWLIVSAVVILWTSFKVFENGRMKLPWPGLHNAIDPV